MKWVALAAVVALTVAFATPWDVWASLADRLHRRRVVDCGDTVNDYGTVRRCELEPGHVGSWHREGVHVWSRTGAEPHP